MGPASSARARRASLIAAAVVAALAGGAPAAQAGVPVRFERIAGYDEPSTPARYDRVGILETGSPQARNILVLIPGTSGGSAYFEPVAKSIVAASPNWQVWSVERRENLLEDQSVLDAAKAHRATPRQLFDYYLGSLSDATISPKFAAVPDSAVPFARTWGMKVAVEDLRAVVREARKLRGRVVLGGHSLGGTITTAYATWDFAGRAGARDLSGLVYIDGGSNTTPVAPDAAQASLQTLASSSPWLAFGGIPAPLAGLFNIVGSGLTKLAPHEPSVLQTWPLLPSYLRGPDRVDNEAGYGYALDTETSPPALAAAQVHAGRVGDTGDVRSWDQAGELSPIQRVADAFFGTGLRGLDGTAWYHPLRLTIDAGAVANGNANPAQAVLDVKATHGADLPKRLRIYAFGAALGGRRVLEAARALARQSGIAADRVTVIDRHDGYSHLDPLMADPDNDFVTNLTRVLARIAR